MQDLVLRFDRGARMPYVERNFRKGADHANPEAWLQSRTE
jgi:hypothetical protein